MRKVDVHHRPRVRKVAGFLGFLGLREYAPSSPRAGRPRSIRRSDGSGREVPRRGMPSGPRDPVSYTAMRGPGTHHTLPEATGARRGRRKDQAEPARHGRRDAQGASRSRDVDRRGNGQRGLAAQMPEAEDGMGGGGEDGSDGDRDPGALAERYERLTKLKRCHSRFSALVADRPIVSDIVHGTRPSASAPALE